VPLESLREPLRALTLQALTSIAASESGIAGCADAIAYFDSSKDELVTASAAFPEVVQHLAGAQDIARYFGTNEAARIALQFTFNTCNLVSKGDNPESAFDSTFRAFVSEATRDHWTYRSVANIQNLEGPDVPLDFGNGLSIRPRSSHELAHMLGWGQHELTRFFEDVRQVGGGSAVLMVESESPKSPDNFLLIDDGSQHVKSARLLLAMRLAKVGEIRTGRTFAARPADFNVGMGGLTMYGFSHWHPGPHYSLTTDDIPRVSHIYDNLSAFDQQPNKTHRNLRLALRAFASIYDRLMHQADDRIVDAITALEALWKLDAELSFRLAFRTSSLLAQSDDERVSIFRTLTEYYKIRSKVVHGVGLSAQQEAKLQDDEPLRQIVRRTLRGFLKLSVSSGEWTLARLDEDTDEKLLHSASRVSIQNAMGVL